MSRQRLANAFTKREGQHLDDVCLANSYESHMVLEKPLAKHSAYRQERAKPILLQRKF